MTGPKVVPLRQEPSLADIVGRLRTLADQIEAGDYEAFQSVVVFGIPVASFKPVTFVFGANMPRHELAGLMFHGAQLALTDRES